MTFYATRMEQIDKVPAAKLVVVCMPLTGCPLILEKGHVYCGAQNVQHYREFHKSTLLLLLNRGVGNKPAD